MLHHGAVEHRVDAPVSGHDLFGERGHRLAVGDVAHPVVHPRAGPLERLQVVVELVRSLDGVPALAQCG